MVEPGKPKFAAFQSLAETVKKENITVDTVKDDTPEGRGEEEIVNQQIIPVPVKPRKTHSSPRISKPAITDDMSHEIMRIAEQIAERAVMDKLYGRRSNYKGPRITRTYKIDIFIDKWLDEIAKNTGIEKSTIVTNAIREYIQDKYADLKPVETLPEQPSQDQLQ